MSDKIFENCEKFLQKRLIYNVSIKYSNMIKNGTELEFRDTFDTMENKNPIATAPIVLAIFFRKVTIIIIAVSPLIRYLLRLELPFV